MDIQAFHDPRTDTITYLVSEGRDALVIDPVLDYDPVGSKVWTESVETLVERIESQDLELHYILETHVHADHLSGAQRLRARYPKAQLAIGARVTEVQSVFGPYFGLGPDFPSDGRQFDRLLKDGERFGAGALQVQAIATPGHTPACLSYLIGDAVFTGDALFMPDQGTGRCDFPRGSAADLHDSISRIYALPPETRVFVGHDYRAGGRETRWESTVAEQRASNVQLPAGLSKEDFVARREARDATLSAPRLLYQSVQVNVRAGELPDAEANEKRYLKVPLNEV